MLELQGTYFTVKELASKLGITVVTLNYHIGRGTLKATKVGQTYLLCKEDVSKFLELKNLRFTKRPLINAKEELENG